MNTFKKSRVSNWGNYPVTEAGLFEARDIGTCNKAVNDNPSLIARGLGRSYGDASLNDTILSCTALNCFITFDRKHGILTAESGVSLEAVLNVAVPAGWFLPVTPGTKYVTLGGAVASDVHGKNHHVEGSFRNFVEEVSMLTETGEIINCGPSLNAEIFHATCGGMGLTGIILSVTIRLKKIDTAYIVQQNYKARNLDEVFQLFENNESATYSVAWTDCLARGNKLGRSVLMTGEHAEISDLKSRKHKANPLKVAAPRSKNMPFYWPPWLLNAYSVKAFNMLYYYRQGNVKQSIVPYEPFFYPLDAINNWNRMYGKKGFVQYQFVLPLKNSYEGIKEVLMKVAADKSASFLVVLKKMGPGAGMLSFPVEGYTLALDFPVNAHTFALLDQLDEIVEKYDGRIYLAKDARMKAAFFHNSYKEAGEFQKIRDQVNPNNKFASFLSKRLNIEKQSNE